MDGVYGVVDQLHGVGGSVINMGACTRGGGAYCVARDGVETARTELVGVEGNRVRR